MKFKKREELRNLFKKLNNKNNAHLFIKLFKAKQAIIKAAKKAGYDVSHYQHTIDLFGLKHSRKHFKDPVPLTEKDILNIPKILNKPDSISYLGLTRGMPRFQYKKKMGGTIYYIEEVRTGRKTLNMVTAYKNKTPP